MAFANWLNNVFGKGSGIDNALKWFDENVLFGTFGKMKSFSKGINGVLQNLGDYIPSYLDSVTGAHMTGAEREAFDLTAQREDTTYQRTVADMQAAGLNPMMLAGGAHAVQSSPAQSSGGDPSALLSLLMLPQQMKLTEAQIRNIDKDTESKDAGIKKTLAEVLHINADTSRISDTRRVLQEQAEKLRLENYVSDVLKGVRIEQGRLNIILTDEQIHSVHNAAERAAKEVELIAEQMESEDAKQALMSVQKNLVSLDVQDKTKYLVYADALYKAQSEEASSNAEDAALKFAYDKQLLTNDYAKAIIDKAKSEAAISENFEWNEQLVHDLVMNRKRPEMYKNGISNDDWRILRNGLLDPVFFNASMQGYNQQTNRGAITNR